MTLEHYEYRTSPLFLRNGFSGEGTFEIPNLPRFEIQDGDFEDLRLIGFDKTKPADETHLDRMVHFFLYDYKFERIWKNPEKDTPKLKRYRAVLTPDFSMYTDMNPAMQLYNTFRNRWCGAYFASKGIRVVPTVNWGNENTFAFCFDGVAKGSTVAVSTYMASEHGNHADQKDFFLKGYNEMLRRIEPEKIICYNDPFPEMEGDIVFVDYDLSSWRHMNDESPERLSKYAKYICGAEPWPEGHGITVKTTGFVVPDTWKGSGNSKGGDWVPSKPEDERFIGKPGEIKRSWSKGKEGEGYLRETIMDENGMAKYDRQHTDHGFPKHHTNPHDAKIDWSKGFPDPGKPINYWDGNVPPLGSLKSYEVKKMKDIYKQNSFEDNQFKSISDFKWCMTYGGEVEFEYNGKTFGAFSKLQKTPDSPVQIMIAQKFIENYEETERWYDTADEALEFMIDGERLRDIVTEVKVWDRTI